jgi:hypothetical protein
MESGSHAAGLHMLTRWCSAASQCLIPCVPGQTAFQIVSKKLLEKPQKDLTGAALGGFS